MSGNHTTLRKVQREARKAEKRLAKLRERRQCQRQPAAAPSGQGG
jgi:hypothetical protein